MSLSKAIKFDHVDYYTELGLNIALYRKKAGLTQERLAEMSGLSRSFISAVEAPNITKNISLESLFCIADVLGVECYKFLMFRD